MKLTATQFEKELKAFFVKESGKSISKAKKEIKKQMEIDEDDNDIMVANVRLFYTANSNYKQGSKNGGGKGFYLAKRGLYNNAEIKL